MHAKSDRLWAVVLAGGEGSRMASLTRLLYGRDRPKQFAALYDDRTFLQCTMDRIAPLVPPDRTVVVVGDAHESLARQQLDGYEGVQIVLQPGNLGTGPGLLLPLAHVRAQEARARVVVFPADHHVRRPEPFLEAAGHAVTAADKAPSGLALIGATAAGPATDMGWILPGKRTASNPGGALAVERFVEKPGGAEAWALLEEGGLWNTMVVAGRVAALWCLLRRCLPEQTREIERYALRIGHPDARATLEDVYRSMPPADLSRAMLQRIRGLLVVPMADAAWSDCGTPARLLECLQGTAALAKFVARLRRGPHAGASASGG
jgi:mannose-1-phosphate guanylyltransferase